MISYTNLLCLPLWDGPDHAPATRAVATAIDAAVAAAAAAAAAAVAAAAVGCC